MRKAICVVLMLALAPFITGCTPIEQSARNTIALATGAIQAAQVEYKAECSALPSAPKCVLINQAVYGQNAAITALEIYCGFQVNVTLPDAVCVPQKTAQGALTTAIANLGQLSGEITALLKAGKKTGALDRARDTEATLLVNTPRLPRLRDLESARIGGGL